MDQVLSPLVFIEAHTYEIQVNAFWSSGRSTYILTTYSPSGRPSCTRSQNRSKPASAKHCFHAMSDLQQTTQYGQSVKEKNETCLRTV
jgi:hypothetical protein